MKIFVTKFTHDEKEYDGPYIHAKNIDEAETVAEANGYVILGELTDIIVSEETEKRVLH